MRITFVAFTVVGILLASSRHDRSHRATATEAQPCQRPGDRTMKFTKILRTTTLAASLAAALGLGAMPSAMADTATGSTTFKVILQPTTLLYYYSEVDLTVPQSVLLALAGGAPGNLGTQAVTANGTATTLSASLATPTGSVGAGISNALLTLSNFWAVRSITTPGTGNTTVTVAFTGTGSTTTTATLTGATTGSTATIGLSGLATTNGTFAGTGLGGTPQTGNVSMNLNLSNAGAADTYQGAAIVITAISS